eukprot:scaffold28961_cov35-Tisochrysis_lutea.AAC.1
MGYIDAHRLVNGPTHGGLRIHETIGIHIHTRIDRLYTPMTHSRINWQRVDPHLALFTAWTDRLLVALAGRATGRRSRYCALRVACHLRVPPARPRVQRRGGARA